MAKARMCHILATNLPVPNNGQTKAGRGLGANLDIISDPNVFVWLHYDEVKC
jgi:hypothetical protein